MTWIAYDRKTWGLLERLGRLKAKEYNAAVEEAKQAFPDVMKAGRLVVKKPLKNLNTPAVK